MITPKTAAIAAKIAGAFREYAESPAFTGTAEAFGGAETICGVGCCWSK
jgi:hypothetical protein